MPGQQKNKEMPNDTWPITRDNKVEIQALGRKLNEFLQKEFAGKESVHIKIVVGAFNYIMDLQTQKTKIIGDDFVLADKSVKAANLSSRIEEPFTVEPEVPEPTVAERRADLEAELASLADEETATEVADASPAPETSAAPSVEPAQG